MPRLRREESQARTRELLVSIARKLFLRDGYQSTSIEKVASEAGFSKGAVYSNFGSKDELCLAVLASLRADEMRAIGQAWSAAHTFDERLAAFTAWAERMIGDTGWTLLEVEFGLSARQNRRLRAELSDSQRTMREAVTAVVEAQRVEFDIESTLPSSVAASALLSLGIGLGIQRMIDRDVSIEPLLSTIRILLGEPRKKSRRPRSK
ncbi:MAG: TetR/AcrR family transcriptional regulator [Polyangiaceae bacterium]